MKVLIFIENSVASRYWSAALPLLRAKDIDAHFACVRGAGDLTAELIASQVPVRTFDAVNSKDYLSIVLKLASFQKREGFEIIHACESIPAAISGMSSYIARKGIRLFHRQHNACPQKTRLFHTIANKTSDYMMTCSESTKRFAAEIDGFPIDKISVAYNGIDPLRNVEEFEKSNLRQSLGINDSDKVITIVARLRQEKGHLTLFEAADLVSKRLDQRVHVVVTGSGYFENDLRNAAAKYDGFTTHFTGHQEDVALYYSIADVVAMPSYSEPFGLVAAEAMSCGKPLVASGVDGLLEVVEDRISGVLVPPIDHVPLAESLLELLTDAELAHRLIVAAKAAVRERFSIETMVDAWVECYRKLINSGV